MPEEEDIVEEPAAEESPSREPGRMTLALDRIERLEETTDVRERPAEVEEAIALARLDMIKAVLTGSNAKWFALLIAFIFGTPALVLGSWATGYGFQVGKNGVVFGAVPMDDAAELNEGYSEGE